ncbi:MAG: hypothetical protein WDA22_10620 [Bacteroidota bacterium]
MSQNLVLKSLFPMIIASSLIIAQEHPRWVRPMLAIQSQNNVSTNSLNNLPSKPHSKMNFVLAQSISSTTINSQAISYPAKPGSKMIFIPNGQSSNQSENGQNVLPKKPASKSNF